MIRTDERGGVVAVVPARLLNPGSGPDLFGELMAAGIGVMALPDAYGTVNEVATTARDAVDYLAHGYRVVVLRADEDERWLPELRAELARWGRTLDEAPLEAGVAATLVDAAGPFLQSNAPGARDRTGTPLLALPDATVWAGSSDPRAPVVLLLHGFGGTEQDLLPYLPLLPEHFAVAAVRAPLPGPDGTAAWFPAGEPGTPLRPEADSAEGALVAWLDATLDGRVVVPVGFSQGGALAIMLLRSRPGLVPAAVTIAGFTIPADRTGDDRLAVLRPPVFAAWDPEDPVVVPAALQRTADWLAGHTTATVVLQHGGVHEVDDAVMAEVGRFLAGLGL